MVTGSVSMNNLRLGLRHFIRGLIFVGLGIVLLLYVQRVLGHKWFYPVDGNNHKYIFDEFYDITQDSDIQALFFGSSHVFAGVDPMAIYRDSGITAYDLATSTQPVEASCAILEDALKRARPRVVFLDASRMFRPGRGRKYYRRILDNMAFSPAKVRLALAYANRLGGEDKLGCFISGLFPIIDYHSRWSGLTETDFTFGARRNLFEKGCSFPLITFTPAGLDVAAMNAADGQAGEAQDAGAADEADEEEEAPGAADYVVEPENLALVLEMKRMCEEAGAQLRLFKVPSLYDPRHYSGAWTRSKSDAIRAVSETYGIPFLDLLYDVDLALDWRTDTLDGGKHLNSRGARKLSKYMAAYLRDACGLAGEANPHYEADLPVYNDVERAAELVCTRDMATYLAALSQMEDVSVFFCADSDMRACLKPEDMAALNAFGLRTDFDGMAKGDAFLAVVDGGTPVYEAAAAGLLEKEGETADGLRYRLTSGGKSDIRLDGTAYGMEHRGLNIVVYHKRAGTVLDRVCFDTAAKGSQAAMRKGAYGYLHRYIDWRAGEDYRQGIR